MRNPKYRCLLCGDIKGAKSAHQCNGGFRKRGLEWEEIEVVPLIRPTEPERQIAIDLFKTILDEATGDLDNPNKRIWPLHSTTYRAIHNFIYEVTSPNNEARECMLMSEDTLAKDWDDTPKQKIAEGLKHFMVNHYAGQFVPKLTGPIIDKITDYYPEVTFGEEDVNEVLCVLYHICDEVEK